VGLALATWMINGEPDGDAFALDVARFGDYATRSYVLDKACEFYSRASALPIPKRVLARRPTVEDIGPAHSPRGQKTPFME